MTRMLYETLQQPVRVTTTPPVAPPFGWAPPLERNIDRLKGLYVNTEISAGAMRFPPPFGWFSPFVAAPYKGYLTPAFSVDSLRPPPASPDTHTFGWFERLGELQVISRSIIPPFGYDILHPIAASPIQPTIGWDQQWSSPVSPRRAVAGFDINVPQTGQTRAPAGWLSLLSEPRSPARDLRLSFDGVSRPPPPIPVAPPFGWIQELSRPVLGTSNFPAKIANDPNGAPRPAGHGLVICVTGYEKQVWSIECYEEVC